MLGGSLKFKIPKTHHKKNQGRGEREEKILYNLSLNQSDQLTRSGKIVLSLLTLIFAFYLV